MHAANGAGHRIARIRHGDTVVDLVVEGVPRSIVYTSTLDQDPDYEHAKAHPDHHEFRTYRRRASYPPIFISYRRLQAETFAGRLQAGLAERFGRSAVFFDEVSLRPGEDFAWTIQQAVWHAPINWDAMRRTGMPTSHVWQTS